MADRPETADSQPRSVESETITIVVEINRADLARNDVPPPEAWAPATLGQADDLGLLYDFAVASDRER